MSYKIAGIYVHKKVLMVVVIDATTPEEKPERRRFATMPSEMRRLSIWLREQGVEEAVMESTAQYWRSVWLELEPNMRLHLAQAFSNRAPRGRKHDFKDAERLVRRLIAKELILSFVPDEEQRTWRSLTRMKPRVANMLVEDHLRPAAVKAGILSSHSDNYGRLVDDDPRRFGFHNLRHSLASFLIRIRTDPKTVQTLLRHSDVKLPLQFYTHAVSRDRMVAAGKMLSAILSHAPDKNRLTAN